VPAVFQDPTVPEYYTRIGGVRTKATFAGFSPLTTRGDLLTRDATVHVRLPIGAVNTVLRSDGTDPSYGKVVLTTDVSGDLPFANIVQIATGRLLGRTTAGTGDIEVLSALPSAIDALYLLADGSRALTADWDAGSFKITAQQLESDIAGGTAPLIVASNTLVSDLNADLLDGIEAAEFIQRDGSVPLTANWDVGAFDIRAATLTADGLTSGRVVFTGASGLLSDSANFTWDNTTLEARAAAGAKGTLLLSTAELTVVDGDILGQIDFQAPLESDGGDAAVVAASIWAEADAVFGATVNKTDLVFATAETSVAVERMRLTWDGRLGIGTETPAGPFEIVNTDASLKEMSWRNATVEFGSFSHENVVDGFIEVLANGAASLKLSGRKTGGLSYFNNEHVVMSGGVTQISSNSGASLEVGAPPDSTPGLAIRQNDAPTFGYDFRMTSNSDLEFTRVNAGSSTILMYMFYNSSVIGFHEATPGASVHITQASTSGAIPVLALNQTDVSEEMMEFITTIGTGNAIEAIAAKTLTTTHFIKVTIPGGLTRYIPVGTIA